MEVVLLSSSISYISMKEKEGYKSATSLKKLKNNIDKPLSAILSLNTVAHTVGAAGVGAQAVALFGEAYFGVISAILTILILVLSEILPKTIGANYWKSIALPSAKIIKWMIIICYPLVWISEIFTRLIASDKKELSVSREEVIALVNVGEEEGSFRNKESKVIQNLMRLGNIKAKDIMTPRIVVAIAAEDMTLQEFYKNKDLLMYSRIPIYSENKEIISGYILRQTVFELLAGDNFSTKLTDLKRDIKVFTDTTSISDLWDSLLLHKEHIALIVDEYGSFEGIVTMEDILESLLGLEILDEKDSIEDMQQYARERWALRKDKYKHL